MNRDNYCLYCQKRKHEVEWLKAIYDWHKPDELTGYYCEKHYDGVMALHRKQKWAYDEMMKNKI